MKTLVEVRGMEQFAEQISGGQTRSCNVNKTAQTNEKKTYKRGMKYNNGQNGTHSHKNL